MKQSFTLKAGPHARAVMANAWGMVQTIHAMGKDATVTVATATRSTMQNARMWAMLTEVSEQVDWYGKKLTPDEWKTMATAALRRQRVVPGIEGGFVVLGESTKIMTKAELSELIDFIDAFGAQHGVKFSALEMTDAAA